jgi:hypothetical protein
MKIFSFNMNQFGELQPSGTRDHREAPMLLGQSIRAPIAFLYTPFPMGSQRNLVASRGEEDYIALANGLARTIFHRRAHRGLAPARLPGKNCEGLVVMDELKIRSFAKTDFLDSLKARPGSDLSSKLLKTKPPVSTNNLVPM